MLSFRSLKLAVLGLTVLVAGCNRESGEKAQPQPSASAAAEVPQGKLDRSHKGSLLPDFTLKDAAGKSLTLASLKGKPALINLWATWCAPCVIELPTLDKIAAEGKVRVVTVSQDMQQTEKVAGFLIERGGRNLTPWLDPENDLAFHYEASTLPTTVLYDAQGREVWRYVGGHDWSGAEAAKLLAEAQS
ncbi:MAG TPA: TlpA disulfide reductase family protein [Novosphingobium sp.]